MRSVTSGTESIQNVLLVCGILAPLLYFGTDRLAGWLLKGYDFSAQSMSELSASGSPTRPLVVGLTAVAAVIMVAFGVGVWRTAEATLLQRVVAALLVGHAATGLLGILLFPTRFGERPSFATAEVLVMFVSVLFFVLAMVVGAVAFGGWLRVVSITVPASYVVLAVLRFATASASSATMVGAQERTMAYGFLAWVMAVAVGLLLSRLGTGSITS